MFVGWWRREEGSKELKNKAEGKVWQLGNTLREESGGRSEHDVTYILFVAEVDGLKRLPGYTFNKMLWDAVGQGGNQLTDRQKLIRAWRVFVDLGKDS